jgi:hypothetical protein
LPPTALRDSIKDSWHLSCDFDDRPPIWEGTPDGTVKIIFIFGSACSLATPAGGQALPSPFLVGLLPQSVLFHATSRLEVSEFKCFPWTVFELLGLPPAKDGLHQLGPPIAPLQAPLANCLQAGNVVEALAQVVQ